MKKVVAGLVLTAGLSLSIATSAQAQVVSLDSVLAACTTVEATVDTCLATQNAYLASLEAQGLPQTEIDAAIGTMVAALAQAAAVNPTVVVAAISNAALLVSNPDQAAAITQVAAAIQAGQTPSAVLLAQIASPN